MAKITYLRSKMSKTKEMALTIGVDSTKYLDHDHDMYFIRSMIDINRTLEQVNTNKPYLCKLDKMGGRYLFFFRNDNAAITKSSILKILELCKSYNVREIAFSEYEIRDVIESLDELTADYDTQIYINIF